MASSWYMSITHAGDAASYSKEPDNTGTSSTATDEIELRILNSNSPAPTRKQVWDALERFQRWLLQGGQDFGGTNLPTDPAP